MRRLDVPLPVPDGGKVVHIGRPKTGTSALQDALHRAREALEEQGVNNVARRRNPFAAARFAAGQPLPHRRDRAEKNWASLARRFRNSTARVTMLSSEGLSGASAARARAIVDDLGGDVTIVVTLRTVAAQLRSQWQQSLVRDGTLTLDEWVKQTVGNERALYHTSPASALDRWGPVVGEERLLFIISDPNDHDALLRRFEVLLGLDVGTLPPPERDNSALSAEGSEFLRQLNMHDPVKRTDAGSVRAEVLRRGTMRIQHVQGVQRKRPTIPRWAAESANEIAATWIERLRASSATVVGRPDDLIRPVDDLPGEVVTPQEISIEEAVRYAHALYEAALRFFEVPDHTEDSA